MWINPDIKALLTEKKRAFKSDNKDELKAVQKWYLCPRLRTPRTSTFTGRWR